MNDLVHTHLTPVRQRQQRLFTLQALSVGLLAGALGGLSLGLGRSLGAWHVSLGLALAVLLGGPIIGLLAGLLRRRSWQGAAAAVDTHYQLKDRTVTALAFLAKPSDNVLYQLQIDDAAQHLANVQPGRVLPLRLPRALGLGAVLAVAAIALLVWPTGPQVAEAGPPAPLAAVVAEAERIEERWKEFEEQARNDENKELEKLAQEIREKVEEMKQPGVDEREALAKLSEMQAAITAQQAQYNVGLVDGQLQALGEAMSAAQALDSAGKALQEAKYEKAAKELEALDDPPIDRKEGQALEEKLKQVAQGMGEVGLGQISAAVSEMAEGVKGGKGKMQKGAREVAKQVSKHGKLKKLNDLLEGELAKLTEGKANCQRNSFVKGKHPEKSLSPSESFGMGTSGNVQGEKTNMLANRNLQEITGTPGEGPSDVETTHSAEGRQRAGRVTKDVYGKYKRMSEAVLDSEPIPLGHRQTIRRYFELIRPQNAETEPKESK
jgi:hypothetical protein